MTLFIRLSIIPFHAKPINPAPPPPYHRPHSSLNFNTPMNTHWNSDVASEVARFQMGQYTERQKKTQIYFSNSPEKTFRIDDHVNILAQKSIFQKSNPFWYPTFQPGTFIVRQINKRVFPWTYSVSRENSVDIVKKLYAFQMHKVHVKQSLKNQSKPILGNTEDKHIVNVIDIIKQNATKLRSGKMVAGKELIFYRIEVDGRKDIITQSGLRLLKKTFGSKALNYSDFFGKVENHKYIL